ncbi:hypothetical protein [Rhodococcus sp. X156]|uniref:hypothetical protein n=1 Tax=Rhodococcus sp. X156 TaxID=2499145 RepID=UPI000FD9949B|nr:hypothetical protein [Rhodococcus sp. X156]
MPGHVRRWLRELPVLARVLLGVLLAAAVVLGLALWRGRDVTEAAQLAAGMAVLAGSLALVTGGRWPGGRG